MGAPNSMHGARARVSIFDPMTATTITVGTWASFGYRVVYDVLAIHILGRYSPAALVTVGVEPVSIDAGGWRSIDHGPYVDGMVRNIKDLLNEDYLLMTVEDRKTGKDVATIQGCLPTSFASQLTERQLMNTSNSYMGLLLGDESVVSSESAGATVLP